MVRKAWFFGDSFTKGFGAEEGSQYYSEYGPGKTFSNLLSQYYNAEEHNLGGPGKCNNFILKTIIEQLPYIKTGDIVVISNTSPLRDLVPQIGSPSLDSQQLFNSSIFPDSIGFNNNKISEILVQYAYHIRYSYLHDWNYHYRSNFINLVKYFTSKNCESIFWDYSVWSEEEEPGMKFENIHMATEGKIYDLHWSYKGHQDAFEWIKDGLEKGIKFLK